MSGLNKLNLADNFKLTNYIVNTYATSKLTDQEFAAKASNDLSMPGLTKDHVKNRREAMEIPNNDGRSKPGITKEEFNELVSLVNLLAQEVKAYRLVTEQMKILLNHKA